MTTALLNKKETAERLRVSQRTLDRLRSEGKIKAVRVRASVRFTEAEIQRFIDKNNKTNN